jgi:hypothetical protein
MNEVDETKEPQALAIAEKLGRRSFLQKLVLGAMGLATALVGLPQKAEALVQVACCVLCKSPTSCSGVCCWTWGCCYTDNRFRRCRECYSSTANCNGGCTGVVCSQAILTTLQC